MTDRDEFPRNVKQAVALRAGYQCSFEGCSALTVGPSDESPLGVAAVGVAAHIHAAAAGGRRYLATMTPDERSSIHNAIWMCATHSTLIDRDEVTYTAGRLRAMKIAHEERIARTVALGGGLDVASELFAIGPDVICLGTILGSQGSVWTLRLEHFVMGDLAAIIAFSEKFETLAVQDRFVLVSTFGDGRVIKKPPAWRRERSDLIVELEVERPAPRSRAQDLGEDIKLDLEDEDLAADLSTVSGADALPQRIRLCLWNQQGETPLNEDFGTRLGEYYHLFGKSSWFAQLLRLEVIRMASIPYRDSISGEESTPFQCVEKVRSVELLADAPVESRLPVRISLDVVGVGSWTDDIRLWISKFPFEKPTTFPSVADLLGYSNIKGRY